MNSILEEFAYGNISRNLIYGFKLGITTTAKAFVTSRELIARGGGSLT